MQDGKKILYVRIAYSPIPNRIVPEVLGKVFLLLLLIMEPRLRSSAGQ